MSAAAQAWAHKAGRRAGRNARRVLRELARRADPDAGVVITIGELAGATAVDLSVRSVQRAVRELEDLELVKVQPMPGTVSMYSLAVSPSARDPKPEVAEVAGGEQSS